MAPALHIAHHWVQDFLHPDLARNIMIYLDETDRPISDFSQSEYLKKLPRSALTPSFYSEGKHFFIDELCRLQNGQLVIPRIWVTRHGKVFLRGNLVLGRCENEVCTPLLLVATSSVPPCADIHRAMLYCSSHLISQDALQIQQDSETLLPADQLRDNFYDISAKNPNIILGRCVRVASA